MHGVHVKMNVVPYVLISVSLGSKRGKRGNRRLWSEWWEACSGFNLLWISTCV